MIELWLKYADESGENKRILVEPEKYVVGRHSGSDLSVADGRLSREHIKIERFGDVFVVSDCDSSNGTTLNGEDLTEPVALKNEDVLNLGGLEIAVELVSDDANAGANFDNDQPAENAADSGAVSSNVSASSGESSIPIAVFWIAPVFGLLIFAVIGGLFFAFSGGEKNERTVGDFGYSTSRTTATDEDRKADEIKTAPTATAETRTKTDAPQTPEVEKTPTQTPPPPIGEREIIGANAASFMRRIAFNDPRPFLTSEQTAFLEPKINQFKNSAALAENLKAVAKNSAQFETLANSKNLKPQFLAIAALTKIGNTRGDPVAVAQAMLPVLSDLKAALDNKLADDNLLIIAGYARREAGTNTALQNVIEGLSKSSQTENITPREIRTIWFLKKKDKLSDAEFDFALRFLAIGAISQNPKDFSVSAEPINF